MRMIDIPHTRSRRTMTPGNAVQYDTSYFTRSPIMGGPANPVKSTGTRVVPGSIHNYLLSTENDDLHYQ